MRALGLIVLFGSSTAAAQAMPPPPGPPPEAPRQFTASLSPIHLLFPIAEVMIEFKPAPHIGIALIGGYGRFTSRTSDPNDVEITGTATEAGGQFSYYFMHDFRGLHVGAEAIYVNISDVDVDSTATGEGLAVGPFIGYKVLRRNGFTFIAQGGAQVGVIRAKTSSAMASDRKVLPLLNLNLGWSF